MILEDIVQENYPEVVDSDYIFNGYRVPRVTRILSEMLHEDSLMSWSNFIGLVKHQKYQQVLGRSADIGSTVHNGIEDYITNNNSLDLTKVDSNYAMEVGNAWNSFLLWWSTVTKNDYKVIMQETPLICQWYGGTLDILLQVSGKTYLFDFKTSNHLSYKYAYQLAAYRYMLRILHNIDVDGVGIIKLDKNSINFQELIIDCRQVDDLEFMNRAEYGFHLLVRAWYERQYIENGFKERTNVI